jgi:NTE family protein
MNLFRTAAMCLLLSLPALPADAEDSGERPKIGLALSGGGARGGAHVGVLKALEELNIPIDYIAGTSMGAIIGGFYAAGYTADEIQGLLTEMDWSAALSDKPDRRNQTMRKKELDASFLIPYRVGFNEGSLQLPMGVIEGQHLDQIFQRILFPVADVSDFRQLSIPFSAVATDLVSGEEVVISGGSLPKALRASMSVPGVFAPVRLNGKLLVDGGMSNNLPVSVVRDMGAEVVIAVDISSPLLKEEQLKSVLSVTEQLTNFLTRKNTQAQIESLVTGQDILLVPDLEGFSSADFEQAGEAVEQGSLAVTEDSERLSTLAVKPAAPGRESIVEENPEYVVNFIDISNESVLRDEVIRSRLDVDLHQSLDFDRLETSLDKIYSLNVFESVTYEIVSKEEEGTGLLIHAIPRHWGPNYLQLGLEFSDDFQGNSEFKIGVGYTRNALNELGGEFRILGALGREDELSIDFYQPIDKQARWFVRPRLMASRQTYNVFFEDDNIAALEISGAGAAFGAGRNFSTTDLLWLDYKFLRGDASVLTGDPDFPVGDVEIGELVLRYRHDSLDSFWFPTEGYLHNLAYLYAADELGASIDYQQLFATGSLVRSWGKNTVLLNYAGGYSFDDAAPVERWFELGGFGRLSGLLPDQLSGRQMGLATLAYYRRLNEIDLIPAYAGMTVEAGNVWNHADDMSFGDLSYSASLFIGAETFIGPVYLAWGHNDSGDNALYFYLGNPFRSARFE